MNKGKLVISLDTELVWGRIDDPSLPAFLEDIKATRKVIQRLLELFEKYDIPVTWAVVGAMVDTSNHLHLLDRFYPNLSREKVEKEYNTNENSLLYGPDILKSILSSTVKHEIASHSYFHLEYGKSSPDLIAQDLELFRTFSEEHRLDVTSHIFSRNNLGGKKLLIANGFKFYRGIDVLSYQNLPSIFKKLLYQLDQYMGWKPQVVTPVQDESGLVNIPGSMIFRKAKQGWLKNVSLNAIQRKAVKGLEEAAKQQRIFHLWFHPFNFAFQEEKHFAALEFVLKKADKLRKEGKLEIQTMKEIGESFIGSL